MRTAGQFPGGRDGKAAGRGKMVLRVIMSTSLLVFSRQGNPKSDADAAVVGRVWLAESRLYRAVRLFFGLRTESPQNGNSPDFRQRLLVIHATKVRQLEVLRLSERDEGPQLHALLARKKEILETSALSGWLATQCDTHPSRPEIP